MSPSAEIARNRLLLILVVLVVGIGVSRILLHAPVVRLKPAPAFTGQVSQDLQPNPNTGKLLEVNKNYTIATQLLDGGQWAVVSIKPVGGAFDPSVVVLEKQKGVYQTQLGPGSTFTQNQVSALPGDVAAYLLTRVGVDEPTL